MDGKIYEIHATPREVIFCISPRRQVRLLPEQVQEALGASGGNLEDVLDESFLLLDKPQSIARFQSVVARYPGQSIDRPEEEAEEE
jgi:hypothetical protein